MGALAIIGSQGFVGQGIARSLKGKVDVRLIKAEDAEKQISREDFDLIVYACEPAVSGLYNAELVSRLENRAKAVLSKFSGHFIYLSSAKVYGSQENCVYLTEDLTPNPSSAYGIFKCEQENFFLSQGMTIFRMTNILGQNMHQNTLLAEIINQLRNHSDNVMLNEIDSVVDYIHTNSVAKAVELVLMKKANQNDIFNLSSGINYTIPQIVEFAARSLNISDWSLSARGSVSAVNKQIVSNQKIKAFGWMPSSNIQESISEMTVE